MGNAPAVPGGGGEDVKYTPVPTTDAAAPPPLPNENSLSSLLVRRFFGARAAPAQSSPPTPVNIAPDLREKLQLRIGAAQYKLMAAQQAVDLKMKRFKDLANKQKLAGEKELALTSLATVKGLRVMVAQPIAERIRNNEHMLARLLMGEINAETITSMRLVMEDVVRTTDELGGLDGIETLFTEYERVMSTATQYDADMSETFELSAGANVHVSKREFREFMGEVEEKTSPAPAPAPKNRIGNPTKPSTPAPAPTPLLE